jgi:hypothetical protein
MKKVFDMGIKQFTIILSLTLLSVQNAGAALIGGIEFPDGALSFADEVVSYSPGSDVGSNSTRNWANPEAALGVPDDDGVKAESVVSLGDGGVLILRFTDNSLTTSGDSIADLHIFEVGAVVERMNIAISTNNADWIDLGFWSGQPASIDIDSISGVVDGELYSYIRLTDDSSLNQTGFPFGEADIDAIGAISSGAAVVPVPVAAWLFSSGLLGLVGVARKKAHA